MSDYVGLNVGGKIYRTSRLTLTRYPDSFFPTLLDGDIPSDKDDQGNYLIDQDGEIFRHVLNFLRYGKLQLPDGFNEVGLLKSQADFFLLPALKDSIDSISLVFYDGKLFNTTKETLFREGSFFTKMLKGESTVLRDPQGNYMLNRDGSVFHHILNYLRDGGMFNPITTDELQRLKEDAKYFRLDVLGNHIQSIQSMGGQSYFFHVYWCPSSPCVVYGASLSSVFDIKINHIVEGGAQSGVLDMDKINPIGPASIQDVENYLRELSPPARSSYFSCPQVQVKHVRLNSNFTRLEATYWFKT